MSIEDSSQRLELIECGSVSKHPPGKRKEFWAVAVYGNDNNLFIARYPKKLPKHFYKYLEDLDGKPIPLDQIYPPFAPDEFTIAPHPLAIDTYVKRPHYLRYAFEDCRDGSISEMFRGEAAVYEALRKRPHPNIAQYFGCIVRNNWIIGICIKKYKVRLYDQLEVNKYEIDKEKCLREVRAGIDHLHEVGFSHNDISPYNIMFDSHGTAVIIDFDSCMPLGNALGHKGGTKGFMKEGTTHAEACNDIYAFKRLEEFLNERI